MSFLSCINSSSSDYYRVVVPHRWPGSPPCTIRTYRACSAASQRASQRARPSAQTRSLSVLLQDALGWWLWERAPVPEEPIPFNLTVRVGEEVGWEWLDGGIRVAQVAANAADLRDRHRAEGQSSAVPEQWNSAACMDSWGVPELQNEVDPRGYIVFSEGRCDALTRRDRLVVVVVVVVVRFPRRAKNNPDFGTVAYLVVDRHDVSCLLFSDIFMLL